MRLAWGYSWELFLLTVIPMTFAENLKRIHPLVAVAAVSVTLFSLAGIAAITGVLPTSHSANREQPVAEVQADKSAQQSPVARAQQPTVQKAGAEPAQHSPAAGGATQTAHKAAPQNSPVGIGVGAVIGGVLGNQVGSGDGKTLATILGAVGGGYVGNEVAKKNQ
jgi:uncharacterized protein YcfJ